MQSPFLHTLQPLWLPVASSLAGALNTVAGGGSFLSLPALLNAMKGSSVGSVSVQATNNVALWPGQLTSAFAYRDDLRRHTKRLLPLSIASFVGGLAGAWLLLITPNSRFMYLLPWLLLFAAVMFVLCEPLGRWLQTRREAHRSDLWLIVGMAVVSFYVGYFGAGGGFLVMALFGVCGVTNIHEVNALKVVTATVSIGIAVFWFIYNGRVVWFYCWQMAILAAIGGYLAARYSKRVNQKVMRRLVASIGFLTAAYFFWHVYGPKS
ncbi:sulfite exporter TauE/SafE family protein [Acidicapsa acidisoli]|uniref:sulfite exporter TauE/SafE family protein n=1 Tax=Acidicapsa acidisoli TaxID=1615681 RepID=UPI0021DFA59A|nr:sulfite exporter TauE/SafE family protein [Acidicapsa acidisoli]